VPVCDGKNITILASKINTNNLNFEEWVQSPSEEVINQSYHIFGERIESVEYLIGHECSTFVLTGDVEEDLLSITAVHPMREKDVKEFLVRAQADWTFVERLINQGKLVKKEYEGKRFYIRRL